MDIDKIKSHYEHAKQKHPYFCDGLIPSQIIEGRKRYEDSKIADDILKLKRDVIQYGMAQGNLMFSNVLECELWEINEALARGRDGDAIEECYDAIAVLLRTIDVIKGEQVLGNPEKKEEKDGE